jgi:hypothetical protein
MLENVHEVCRASRLTIHHKDITEERRMSRRHPQAKHRELWQRYNGQKCARLMTLIETLERRQRRLSRARAAIVAGNGVIRLNA